MKRFLLFLSLWALVLGAPGDLSASQKQKVEIFVTSWCPYCRHLETFLKQNGVDYTRYDVERDERGAELFSRLGGQGVPLTRIGTSVIPGYDPEAIADALRN